MATRSIPIVAEDGQMENPDWRLQVPTPGNVPHTPPGFDEDDPVEETAVDRVFSVLETARGAERATIKLYRVGPKPNSYAWCDDYSVEDFEAGGFAMIRDKWGPGEYEIRLYAIRPSDGRFGVLSKPRIVIEQSLDAQRNPVNTSPAVDPAMREMLSQMAQTQARMLEALTQRPDPMANMQQMLTLAASFKQAFGGGDTRPQNTISEIMGAIREMKAVAEEISPPKPPESDDTDNPLKLLPSVLDLVGKFAPQAGTQGAPTPAAFPAVTLPQSFNAATALPSPDAVSLPVTQPNLVPIQSPQPSNIPSDDEMNALQLVLMRGYLSKLCAMNAAGNVEAGAEFALAKLPDEAIDILETPEWFTLLSQFYPAAANHKPWLEAVRARVLQMVNDEGNAS
jgi:hypothetical protein